MTYDDCNKTSRTRAILHRRAGITAKAKIILYNI